MRAFEHLHPADGLRFEIRSEIPLARGLGSSAAAIVAGLVAADHLFELGLERDAIYRHAVELEGHPDNVAAALYGGFVVCPRADGAAELPAPVRLAVPEGVEAVLVIPDGDGADRRRPGRAARDGGHRRRGRQRRRGEPARARARAVRPGADRARPRRSAPPAGARAALPHGRWSCSVEARELGALGRDDLRAPGPSLLLWSFWQDTGKVVEAATKAAEGWAEVRRVPFTPLGADVPEL